LIGAPIEYDLYDALKEKIHTHEVFACANEGRYADNICCTSAELNGEHPLIADWYRPFVEWKCEKNEKGISHETAKYQKVLALGDYAYALAGTEKLLDSFPDDEEILLLNISARMSLAPSVGLEERVKLLSENFRIITDAFKTPLKKYHYFLYYRGLTQLGMNMPDHAEADFRACLEIDARFEPALMMLKGIENAKNEDNDNLN
jgi:tetratricopeptide (TPR) repeat protein